MRYTITSTTEYRYSGSAARSHHMVRVLPADRLDQHVRNARLTITPTPQRQGTMTDFFGNTAQWFHMDASHDTLSLAMTADVEVTRQPDLLLSATHWEETAAEAARFPSLAPNSPAHFLRPTPLTQSDAALRIYASRVFTSGAALEPALMALTQAIQADLAYDQEATHVESTAIDAFGARAGVCQDFAHIMIAACRSVGVPARYVSGYLRTLPAPGAPRLEGADAMHAWVSVWGGPTVGWMDFDPTNGCRVANDHIIAAVGRDYADTAPMRGEIVAAGTQGHKIAVDVAPQL